MVVEEGERGANREGVKPQGDLRQLHGHWILVDAVDAALQDHAADDVPILQVFPVDGPLVFLGLPNDFGPNTDNVTRERGLITRLRPIDRGLRLRHGRQDAVSQPVDQTNEEMPRAHGRVANLQVENAGGGV
jgi:hypothetical protein